MESKPDLSQKDYNKAMQELFAAFGGRASDFTNSLSKLYDSLPIRVTYDSLPIRVTEENVDYHVYRLIRYVAACCAPQGITEIDVLLFPLDDFKSFKKYYRMLSVFMRSGLDGGVETPVDSEDKTVGQEVNLYPPIWR